ncbi:uncharacterized protein Tco025E_09858 [Trypanosoma conorhini]|uniref:MSP domain-containing protein n=1 Tax=Trypanosoma conorhini TaxID=83891 RepID=A0A422MRY0_9TRYP|nr:uncharacterized protein Tco025E_09858 [Trypanosoma conorhini]RNE95931.1 hypothetical protein Tco025E_09858 [Trypanosoma conorhini]
MAVVSGSLVQLSQESLYFPLPLKDITIENIVQVRNLLGRSENKAENVIAFKVLGTVRSRYSVRPSTGLIFPGERAKIRFLLDVPQLRRQASKQQGEKAAVTLPDANTKDELFVDIAVLPKDQAKACIESSARDNNGEKAEGGTAGMYVEQAAAFWKMIGTSKPKEMRAERRKLSCVYGEEGVPESLVMRISGEKPGSAVPPPLFTPSRTETRFTSSPPLVPKTRPQTNNTDATRRSPPPAPPRCSPSASARSRDKSSPYADSSVGATPPKSRPLPMGLPGANSGSLGGGGGSVSRPPAAALNPKPALAHHLQPLWKECLFYRVSSKMLVVLLFLSFLCALFESGTFLSRLLIGQ